MKNWKAKSAAAVALLAALAAAWSSDPVQNVVQAVEALFA